MLVTGTPPGASGVGEVILRDLILHHGPDRVRCAAIVGPDYRLRPDARIAGTPVELIRTGVLRAPRWTAHRLGAASSLLAYGAAFRPEIARIVGRLEREADAWKPDLLFAVLNNPAMFPVAHRLAAKLGKPLVSLVWDPPEYLLGRARFDRVSRGRLLADFRRSLAASERVAVVSETMRADYAAFTDADIRLLRYGLQAGSALAPSSVRRGAQGEDEWVIGFAGSMYAVSAFHALLDALDGVDWRVAGRPVRIRVYAPDFTLSRRRGTRIEYLGYPPQVEADEGLRDCHLMYLPQPFEEEFEAFSRYSFPTKLSAYAAIGRPVFVHAPADSALSRFYDTHPLGARATSLQPQDILAALRAVLGDARARGEAERRVAETARKDFSSEAFLAAVDWMLEGADGEPTGSPA